jgi:hypothetical protein
VLHVILALAIQPTPKPSAALEKLKTIGSVVSKPLRRLVYSIDMSSRVTGSVDGGAAHEPMVDPDKLNGDAAGGGTPVAWQDTGKGTVTIDVMHALGDGSLVLIVSEDAGRRRTQPLLLGVTAYGSLVLSADAYRNLLPEEAQLASLLARYSVTGQNLAPGSSWEVQEHDQGDSTTTYSVKDTDGLFATIAVKNEQVGKDASGTRYGYTGSMYYDVKHSALQSGKFDTFQTGDELGTRLRLQMHAEYKLLSDSLGAAPSP